MPSDELRAAVDALSNVKNNLLTAKVDDVQKFGMQWGESKYVNNVKVDKSKGVWLNADNTNVVIPLIGLLDLSRSNLGPYGNCYWNKEKSATPNGTDLGKSKFNIALTHMFFRDGSPDNDLVAKLWNQFRRMDDIETKAIHDLKAAGDAVANPTDWARFEENDDGPQGWMHINGGYVYKHSTKRVKGSDIKDLSPRKVSAPSTTEKKKPDIEEDPSNYLENAGDHKLRHNDELPFFTADGVRVGRTSAELRKVFYHGRWVRADVEMLMWNMQGKQIFQLNAVRIVALDCPPAHAVNGLAFAPLLASSYTTMGANDDEGKGKDDETLSESSKDGKSKKRGSSAAPEGEPSAKKAKD